MYMKGKETNRPRDRKVLQNGTDYENGAVLRKITPKYLIKRGDI